MIKRKKPIVKGVLTRLNGSLDFSNDQRIEYMEINEMSVNQLNETAIVFDTVIFNHCQIQNSVFLRAQFIDCIFNHCHFTNNRSLDSTFLRCEWQDSKLDASHFIRSNLEHILIKNSTARYLDIADSVLKAIEIIGTKLDESSWFQSKMLDLSLKNTSMEKAEIYHTSFKDIDLSSTIISGMRIELNDIKGAIIDENQAPLLCQLIGVKIKN